MPRRRPTGPIRTVAASVLAVLALVGCVTAILLLAIEPRAARLEGQVAGLSSRLAASRSELGVLERRVDGTDRRGSQVAHDVGRLSQRVRGLQRTVSGLQNGAQLTREQAVGLSLCVAGLRQSLAGLSVQSRSVAGRLTGVGLSDPAPARSACPELAPPR